MNSDKKMISNPDGKMRPSLFPKHLMSRNELWKTFLTHYGSWIGLILLGSFSRLIPHPPNITTLTALSIFAGFGVQSLLGAIAVPLAILLITDMSLGFHSTLLGVYIPFVWIVLLSHIFLRNFSPTKETKTLKLNKMSFALRLTLLSISSTLLFYLTSNFEVWISTPLYPKTIEGLWLSYTVAIPFLRYQFLGDLFYTILFFGLFFWLERSEIFLERAFNWSSKSKR